MRALIYCPGSDPAGVGIGLQRACAKHSDWEVRQVRRKRRTYDYPYDAEWSEFEELIGWADVVHVMEEPRRIPAGKPAILHHHGSFLRKHQGEVLRRQVKRGALGITSTLDLTLMAPDILEWLPSPVQDLSAMRRRIPGPLRIAHAPTNRVSKSTGPFLAACERLGKELPIEVLLIESRPWHECLEIKATADIYFDQVLTGYGVNALEAMSLGTPVIAGVEAREATRRGYPIHPDTLDTMERRFDGLPFVRADEGTIYDALRLLADESERIKWAERGLAHVARFHSEEAVVRQLEDIYRRAVS